MQYGGYNSQIEESKDEQQSFTLREFLDEHKLQFLEQSLLSLGITMEQLYRIHIDDINDLCLKIKLNEYPQQEILFRSAINQLQSENGNNDNFVARSATARSISHIVKEKKSKHESQNTKDYDHLVKLVMVGDAAVGKSNLVVRFCDDAFEDGYISTIGVDFKFRTLQYNDILVKLQVWDTAGQERFRAITSAYYRSADGLLLCYDITNKSSFDNLEAWIGEIRKHTQNFVMLVGCKLDIIDTSHSQKRKVKTSEAQTFAHKHDLQFIEVSAKSTENVDNLFFTATDFIMQAILNNTHSAHGATNSISVDPKLFKKKKKRKCCK
mmetsp:Transcript_20378/g.18009  ORF Transcript_20378/g.18009 Transcript_20378/m.18009 type:complete len:324 (+) Transcript_20378:91-1062(+)